MNEANPSHKTDCSIKSYEWMQFIFPERVTKLFDRVDASIEGLLKPVEQVGASTERVIKPLERVGTSTARVIKPVERVCTSTARLTHGLYTEFRSKTESR